jgi:hypothetical protein
VHRGRVNDEWSRTGCGDGQALACCWRHHQGSSESTARPFRHHVLLTLATLRDLRPGRGRVAPKAEVIVSCAVCACAHF